MNYNRKTEQAVRDIMKQDTACSIYIQYGWFEYIETKMSMPQKQYWVNMSLANVEQAPYLLETECLSLKSSDIFYESCDDACKSGETFTRCKSRCVDPNANSQWACLNGCNSLHEATTLRSGTCPPEVSLDQTVLSQRSKCSDLDAECLSPNRKCCQGVCTLPQYHDYIPEKLSNPRVIELKPELALELSWEDHFKRHFTNPEHPIVYVLRMRSYFGPTFNIRQASTWMPIAYTTKFETKLQIDEVGKWYQFQLAAVSPFGSQGFDASTPPVNLTGLKASPPQKPRNLQIARWNLTEAHTIHLTIQWTNSPQKLALPASAFHVTCAKEHQHSPLYDQTIETNKIVFEALEPGTNYIIEVRALTYWGPMTMKSEPAVLAVTTPLIEKESARYQDTASPQRVQVNLEEEPRCVCGGIGHNSRKVNLTFPAGRGYLEHPYNVTILPSIYENGIVKSKLIIDEYVTSRSITDYGIFNRKSAYSIDQSVPLSSKNISLEIRPKVCIDSQLTQSSRTNLHFVVNMEAVLTKLNLKSFASRADVTLIRSQDFTISPLKFNCLYLATIREPFSQDSQRKRRAPDPDQQMMDAFLKWLKVAEFCFCTPSCQGVTVAAWAPRPDCGIICEFLR
ncbi:hypothetical protein Ciccas_000926 [Cichlidogyrus casuarinus]|uniref:Fibronectin type-III domain-containing protein n=1 Tax=Cichlidogyrus casuarinus TaxID=1844966 RepID=A0ABD2QLZ8_9PLAT